MKSMITSLTKSDDVKNLLSTGSLELASKNEPGTYSCGVWSYGYSDVWQFHSDMISGGVHLKIDLNAPKRW